MKNLNLIIVVLFLVSGISLANAQDVNVAANSVSGNVIDNKEAMGNLQEDNQEIVNDEGYGVDDKEYYGSEENAEIEDAQLGNQISDALENEMPEDQINAVESNGTK